MRSDFIIPVNKPLNWTSFDVVNKLKYMLNSYPFENRVKVGHAGTLDPLATGLLVVCTGKCTKQIAEIQEGIKLYEGIIRLGASTPSYDLETEINQTFPTDHITEKMIQDEASKIKGTISQIPPVFSALKVKGKKAYELARKGRKVELHEREVFIESFRITKIAGCDLYFNLTCSKGTYVRSIAHDFGKALGSGAHLARLVRTQVGSYYLKDAIEIEQVKTFFDAQLKAT